MVDPFVTHRAISFCQILRIILNLRSTVVTTQPAALQPDAVALHSYNLSDSQKASLQNDGIRVFRRLRRRVFRQLEHTVTVNGGAVVK